MKKFIGLLICDIHHHGSLIRHLQSDNRQVTQHNRHPASLIRHLITDIRHLQPDNRQLAQLNRHSTTIIRHPLTTPK